jgi:hypothetical protein
VVKTINGYGGGYSGDLEPYLSADGLRVLLFDDIPATALLLLDSWGRHFAAPPGSSWFHQGAAYVLLALALVGAAQRAARKAPDFLYAALYLLIVLVWPYPAHNTRFLYPLIPIALVYAFMGLSLVLSAAGKPLRQYAPAALLLAVLAMIYPNVLFVTNRFLEPVPEHIPEDYRHTRHWLRGNDIERIHREADQKAAVIRTAQADQATLRRTQCVYAGHPVFTMLYSDRISIIFPRNGHIEKLWVCRYLIAVNLQTIT